MGLAQLVRRFFEDHGLGVERTAEAYYNRFQRLRPAITADQNLLDRIRAVFEHEYNGKDFPVEVQFLDGGERHKIYNVGRIVDPLTGREIHLALRILDPESQHYRLYCRKNLLREKARRAYEDFILAQIYRFQRAFVTGDNPPYFIGMVSCAGVKTKFNSPALGILSVDVTEGKKYELKEDLDDIHRTHFDRIDEKGRKTRFFLDADSIGDHYNKDAEKYFSEGVRIDIR